MVVDCHHSFRFCGDRMELSLPKKERLTLLPGSHLGQNFAPVAPSLFPVLPKAVCITDLEEIEMTIGSAQNFNSLSPKVVC